MLHIWLFLFGSQHLAIPRLLRIVENPVSLGLKSEAPALVYKKCCAAFLAQAFSYVYSLAKGCCANRCPARAIATNLPATTQMGHDPVDN